MSFNPDSDPHDSSRSDTPTASTNIHPPILPMILKDPLPIPLHLPPSSDSHSTQFLLPVPIAPTNRSQASFTLSDVLSDVSGLDPLTPEIASADVSIAPDGTFVETSFGPAARELKKLYDQQLGVGMSVRSPYAITAFVNQHGKEMYRIGHRDLSAPAVAALEAEDLASQPKLPPTSWDEPQTTRSKRRSRLSMHVLFPPSMFKNGGPSTSKPQAPSAPHRKLRKTRSIPDMFGFAASVVSSAFPNSQGRAHSHSVTGADMSCFLMPPPDTSISVRTGDIFSEVMNWRPSTNLSTTSLQSPGGTLPAVIANPFGPGVTFDSPSARPLSTLLPSPVHMLREMQSFESGRTARQADSEKSTPQKGKTPDITSTPSLRVPSVSSFKELPAPPIEEAIKFVPLPETSILSRYSTAVFDVLQTYRGLPLLDKLSPDCAETTVIKMSLSADDTPAPRDDPRFVIWGEFISDRDLDDASISHGSFTDLSSNHSSSVSRKRSTKGPPADLPSLRISSSQGMVKVVVAATIERWIAQLTSELNYDELLNFFLTYRTYITAIDLCHLLICRFHWALARHASPHDEMVRRIVRVRTFVAIRYWLLTFFVEDFLPNRELRLLVANWLNTLFKDPILEKHNDGLNIVRKLKKVVKDCKATHSPSHKSNKSKHHPSTKPPKTPHVLGEKFAEAIATHNAINDDSDVDLDFLPDEMAQSSDTPNEYPSDPPNSGFSTAHVGGGISSPTPMSLAALAVLQQTHRSTETDFPPVSLPLPGHHNPISRAFVNTIGKLGRWKRVLNARSASRPPLAPCSGVSAFDLDLNGAAGDLLGVDGGVDQYFRLWTVPGISDVDSIIDITKESVAPPEDPPKPEAPPDYVEPTVVSVQVPVVSPDPVVDTPSSDVNEETPVKQPVEGIPVELVVAVDTSEKASIRTSSTSSFGKLLSPESRAISIPAPRDPAPWQFDIVSIDDLDLSDTSSGHEAVGPSVPPGLRKVPRKLPLRRDFEFVRRSQSAESTRIHSHDSLASGRSSSITSVSSAGGGLGSTIQQWQVNALVDSLSNGEEGGDVEAALRRLEGQIHPQKVQENASKVDGWVRSIQERMAVGDYSVEPPRPDDDDDDEQIPDDDVGGNESDPDPTEDFDDPPSLSSSRSQSAEVTALDHIDSVKTPVATHTPHPISTSPHGQEPNATPEEVLPAELRQNMISPRPLTVELTNTSLTSKFGGPEVPRAHRSFILGYRAQTLVEHFSMIDRELFMGIKFEELFLDHRTFSEDVDVLDWMQFLKDRVQWKAESRWPHKTSALATVRARFNLLANFTISEVALTQPSERALVVGKFIRIAWKAYSLSNFNTLVAIIAGLRSELVSQAMRRSWNRVGMWEMRMLNDLKIYASNVDDFVYIRRTIDAIADAKPLDVSSRTASIASVGGTDSKGRVHSDTRIPTPSACIPFIGVYLSQLRRHGELPDLIDPTAPNEAVGIDSTTSNFDSPAHPEVFSSLAPLPPSMQLEPLINVHKQRLIAGVIKSLVAGQHLASRVEFLVDKRAFQKCLKLRALDMDTLRRAVSVYPD